VLGLSFTLPDGQSLSIIRADRPFAKDEPENKWLGIGVVVVQ
jgi:hypothetical protein